MILLKVTRKKQSWNFKRDPSQNSFANNSQNVFLDELALIQEGNVIFLCKCQSVSNHPDSKPEESIAPGKFQIKCFGPRNLYANPVHVIINAYDLEGERIREDGMQMDAESGLSGRWLIHDDWNATKGRPYSAPFSAGCIMLPYAKHRMFNAKLEELGFEKGDLIDAELVEEATND